MTPINIWALQDYIKNVKSNFMEKTPKQNSRKNIQNAYVPIAHKEPVFC